MLYHQSQSSSGCCAGNYYKYGQVVSILSLLVTVSTLVLLLITVVDVTSHEYDHNHDNHHHQTHNKTQTQLIEQNCTEAIKIITILYIIAQMLALVIGLKSVVCTNTGATFVLTVGVKESSGAGVRSYGATGDSNSPINKDDIIVYYRKVGDKHCCDQLEPLTVPVTGWMLPLQIFSLSLSLAVSILYIMMSMFDAFYRSFTVVILLNFVQQSVQVIFTYILSTDIGFCCPGVSYTRWFLHQDFYTKMLETVILRKFLSSSRPDAVSEWFRISGEDASGRLERAGEVRLLQHLLETSHDVYYRQVFPGNDVAVSLFLTLSEIWSLASHFSNEDKRDQEEMIIYSVVKEEN